MKQCHSLPVGHGIIHDWWDCLARNKTVFTHFLFVKWDVTWLVRLPSKDIYNYSLPVHQWMRCDWWDLAKKLKLSLLTACWSMDETWWDFLWMICAVTYPLLFMVRHSESASEEIMWHYSHPVQHEQFNYLGFTGRKPCNYSLSVRLDVWDSFRNVCNELTCCFSFTRVL